LLGFGLLFLFCCKTDPEFHLANFGVEPFRLIDGDGVLEGCSNREGKIVELKFVLLDLGQQL
jgi:hypothetical protein